MRSAAWDLFAQAALPRLLWLDERGWLVASGCAHMEVRSGPQRLHPPLAEHVGGQAHPAHAGLRLVAFAFDPEGPACQWVPGQVWGDHPAARESRATQGAPPPGAPRPAGPATPAAADLPPGFRPAAGPQDTGLEAQRNWARQAQAALQAIRSGRLDKAVLARVAAGPGAHAAALAQALADEPGAVVFALEDSHGAWVGATPETLVRVEAGRLQTHALAATHVADAGGAGAAAGPLADPLPDRGAGAAALLDDPKSLQEHALVVAAILDRLAALGVHATAGPRRLRHLRTLQHVETPMEAPLGTVGALQVAQALHPTPATCGWPTEAALQLLRGLETFTRGLYGGGLGWLAPSGDAHVVVPLRCAYVERERSLLFAGAGIVAASDPAAEWQETEAKLATMRRAFAEAA